MESIEPAGPERRICRVFCRPESDQAIVASMHNHGALKVEKIGGASIVKFSDAVALHEAIVAALNACDYPRTFNYHDRKKSDWPAYRASGYKTIKGFEAEFVLVHVEGAKEKGNFYYVTMPELGKFGLHLGIRVNAYRGNLGEAIPYIVDKYLACRAVVNL